MKVERLFPLKDNGQHENVIAVRFYYDLGGTDFWNGKAKPRGYYMSLIPMWASGNIRSYSPLGCGGGYVLIEEVSRQSKKRRESALAKCQQQLPELMAAVLRNKGFELQDDVVLSIA